LIANQRLGEGVSDIITGRRPSSDLQQLVNDWRNNRGDRVRKEYEQAPASAGSA